MSYTASATNLQIYKSFKQPQFRIPVTKQTTYAGLAMQNWQELKSSYFFKAHQSRLRMRPFQMIKFKSKYVDDLFSGIIIILVLDICGFALS